MASAKDGSVQSGVGSSRLGDLGERRELPSGVRAEPRPKMDFGVF